MATIFSLDANVEGTPTEFFRASIVKAPPLVELVTPIPQNGRSSIPTPPVDSPETDNPPPA